MTYRNHKNQTDSRPFASAKFQVTLLKSTVVIMFVVTALAASALAGELPEAPSSSVRIYAAMTPVAVASAAPNSVQKVAETHTFDKKFVSLAIISSGSTFADSYTTLFARENWLAHKQGVCNIEVQSAYLYGTHPTVGRAYAVASAKSAGAIFAAYYLRKHHSRFWSAPLIANSMISLEGVTQNMIACN
ncbi:MAG: hypothetical protein WBQ03_24515 [Candidatus Sulfotelmatobacter sp.]